MIFRGDVFFWAFFKFFSCFLTLLHFSQFSVCHLTQWHSSVIGIEWKLRFLWPVWLSIYHQKNNSFSFLASLPLKIQLFTYVCHFTYCKICTKLLIDGIFYRVFDIFLSNTGLTMPWQIKFDFLTHGDLLT